MTRKLDTAGGRRGRNKLLFANTEVQDDEETEVKSGFVLGE